MRTNNRSLTYKEQEKLYNDMKNKGVSQVMIARDNNLSGPYLISQVCRGVYNVTPLVKKYFNKSGIDLDVIMDENVIITLNDNLPVSRRFKPKLRRLTGKEIRKLYSILYDYFGRPWTQAELSRKVDIRPQMVSKLLKGTYPASPMIVGKFKKINIDLEDL